MDPKRNVQVDGRRLRPRSSHYQSTRTKCVAPADLATGCATRIIAISGADIFKAPLLKPGNLVGDSYLALAIKAGADATMQKPFDVQDLRTLIPGLSTD